VSRFRSESRFMDPHRPATGQARPITAFFVTNTNIQDVYQNAHNHGFDFDLDRDAAVQGHPIQSRIGAYRRGFRKSGPEIGEGKNVNG
jgi:hypothetical protein